MATTQKAFTNRILQIPGVKHFILVKENGKIIAHNVITDKNKPEDISSTIVSSAIHSEAIRSTMGFTHFNCLKISRENSENILVFPIKNYFLGIFQEPDDKDPETSESNLSIIENIVEFIHGVAV